MLSIFSCTISSFGHLYVFFGKISIQFFFPFLNWGVFFFLVLIYMSSLYILDFNPLSSTWFANIFSSSKAYLFVDGFFCCAEHFQPKVILLIYFYFCAFDAKSKTSLPRPISGANPHCFLLGVLQLQLLDSNLYSLLSWFCICCKIWVKFHSLHVNIQFSQHYLLKILSFTYCILLVPLL